MTLEFHYPGIADLAPIQTDIVGTDSSGQGIHIEKFLIETIDLQQQTAGASGVIVLCELRTVTGIWSPTRMFAVLLSSTMTCGADRNLTSVLLASRSMNALALLLFENTASVRPSPPAVVGTGDGTKRIKSGQRIRVDGDQGVVTVLEEA